MKHDDTNISNWLQSELLEICCLLLSSVRRYEIFDFSGSDLAALFNASLWKKDCGKKKKLENDLENCLSLVSYQFAHY